ncbi:MAG: alginate export family protein, partial [Polyangiaceae bacterium]
VVELTSPPTRAGTVSGMLGWRALWLAQARDAWIGSGLRDPTGQSGNFLGHQLEGSLRYEPFVGNLQLEVGAAHLFAGRFVSDAPGANPDTQSTVVYAQVVSQL